MASVEVGSKTLDLFHEHSSHVDGPPLNDFKETNATATLSVGRKIHRFTGSSKDVAIAPGATPDHMLASFVALLRLYFQYVQQRRKAMGTLLKELLLQTSVVLPSLPEELLGDNVVAPPDDTQQPSPSLPEVVPTTPNSTQGKTVPQQKRNTTVRQKLNFSYDAQAFSPPPKKAKAKATTLTQVTIPKKTRTKNTARREPQLPREFYEKVGSISTSFESTNSLSTHAPDVTPTPSAPAPIGCRVQRKAAKII
ncbi:hypothetical protein V6N11_069875 [Hibiscus sabdariffa]|uniref:Uncharacterized protein n=1 Tax=Hibiscus sabdariffa TaxID=183260 RepID=A0ABR2Q423_9ROSI